MRWVHWASLSRYLDTEWPVSGTNISHLLKFDNRPSSVFFWLFVIITSHNFFTNWILWRCCFDSYFYDVLAIQVMCLNSEIRTFHFRPFYSIAFHLRAFHVVIFHSNLEHSIYEHSIIEHFNTLLKACIYNALWTYLQCVIMGLWSSIIIVLSRVRVKWAQNNV